MPLPFEVQYDYSYDGIMRSMEDSFQRLGLAKIDILFVHDIGVYQHGAEANAAHMKVLRESGYRALESLRGSGAVQAMGRNPEAEGLIRTYMFLGFALAEALFIFALVFGIMIGFGII